MMKYCLCDRCCEATFHDSWYSLVFEHVHSSPNKKKKILRSENFTNWLKSEVARAIFSIPTSISSNEFNYSSPGLSVPTY